MEVLYMHPQEAFRGRFPGWAEFLGSGRKTPGKYRTLEQWLVFAEALAEERGGILPCMNWIKKNHPGLAFAIRNRPDLFEHIPQEKPQGHYRTPEQWVPFAEALAEEHGGIMPYASRIKKNHPGLYAAMCKHPKLFEHILREELRGRYRSPEEWVPFAKALAEEHGGILPHTNWIKMNHPGLNNAIRIHPERFAGIRQEVRDTHGRVTGYRVLGTREAV